MLNEVSIDELKQLLDYLSSITKIEYDPYPEYDNRIYKILGSLDYDDNYLSKSEKVLDTPINELNLDDIKVMYTFIARGERFCLGHIASYVENGTLLKLLQREIEILSVNEEKEII